MTARGPLFVALLVGLAAAYVLLRKRPQAAAAPEAVDLSGVNFLRLPPKPSLPSSSLANGSLPVSQATPAAPAPAPTPGPGVPAAPAGFNPAEWIAQQAQSGAASRAAATQSGHGPANFHASAGFNSDAYKESVWAEFVANLNSAVDSLAGGSAAAGDASKLQLQQVE